MKTLGLSLLCALTLPSLAFAGECIGWDDESCAICLRELAETDQRREDLRMTLDLVSPSFDPQLPEKSKCRELHGEWGCFPYVCLVEQAARAAIELQSHDNPRVRGAATAIFGSLHPWRVCDGQTTVPALKLVKQHYPKASSDFRAATKKILRNLYTEDRGMKKWARPCHTFLREWLKTAPEELNRPLAIGAARVAMWEENEALLAPLRSIPAVLEYAESKFPLPGALESYFELEQQGMLHFVGDAFLRRLRNAVFARHGRKFEDPELQKFFGSQSWYKPRDGFSRKKLTRGDRINIKLISKEEKRRKAER